MTARLSGFSRTPRIEPLDRGIAAIVDLNPFPVQACSKAESKATLLHAGIRWQRPCG